MYIGSLSTVHGLRHSWNADSGVHYFMWIAQDEVDQEYRTNVIIFIVHNTQLSKYTNNFKIW